MSIKHPPSPLIQAMNNPILPMSTPFEELPGDLENYPELLIDNLPLSLQIMRQANNLPGQWAKPVFEPRMAWSLIEAQDKGKVADFIELLPVATPQNCISAVYLAQEMGKRLAELYCHRAKESVGASAQYWACRLYFVPILALGAVPINKVSSFIAPEAPFWSAWDCVVQAIAMGPSYHHRLLKVYSLGADCGALFKTTATHRGRTQANWFEQALAELKSLTLTAPVN